MRGAPRKARLARERSGATVLPVSKTEILNELPKLSPGERQEIRARLAELDEENGDEVAFLRAEELSHGKVQPKTQAEIFGNARAALK